MFDPIGAYHDSKVGEAFSEGEVLGKKQVMAQGVEQSREQTIDCVQRLYRELILQGWMDDIKSAAEDTDYLMVLLKERGLNI